MLIGAIGCNLAWGIVDATFYLMNAISRRGHILVSYLHLRETAGPEEGNAPIVEALPPLVASILRREELDSIRQRLLALPEPRRQQRSCAHDFRGALGVFLLVFLSTFPVVVPFLFIRDAMPALRVSNAVAIALLFYGGYKLGKYAGYRPWLTALAMVAIGLVLVALTIALGG